MARLGFLGTSGSRIATVAITFVVASAGCQQVLGIMDLPIGAGGAHAGGAGGSAGNDASSSGTAGSSNGGSTSSSSGMGTSSSSGSSSSGMPPTCFNCAGWTRTLSGANNQIVNDIAVDSMGNVVFVGSITGDGDLGADCSGMPCLLTVSSAPNKDVFIVKLHADGTPFWVKVIGDMTDSQEATGVAIDAMDNIFVIGQFQGTVDFGNGPLTSVGDFDIFVAKIAPDGSTNNTWSKRFGDSVVQRGSDIAIDAAQHVIVTGFFKGAISFNCMNTPLAGNNSFNIFLAQLDNNGQCIWSNSYGDDASSQLAYGAAIGKSDQIFITGECKGMIEGQDCGSITPHIFLASFNSDGTSKWANNFGDDAHLNFGRGVATDDNGDVYMTGEFQGTLNFVDGAQPMITNSDPSNLPDVFLSKFGAISGKAIWTQSLQGTGAQIGHRTLVDNSNGRIFVAGKMDGSVLVGNKSLDPGGTPDTFVVSYDLMGNPQCGANYDNFMGVNPSLALAKDGDLLFGFNFQNTVTLNCIQQPIMGVAGADALIAKIKF